MRSLLSCLLLVGLFGSPEQGSQDNTKGTASAEGQAAQIDRMLSENPDLAKALSERLSRNPLFIGAVGEELRKSRPLHQQQWTGMPTWSPFEDIEPRPPGFTGNGIVKFPLPIDCDSNADLSDVIKLLAGEEFLNSVLSYETSHAMNSKQVHQYRTQTISSLIAHLRERAEAKK